MARKMKLFRVDMGKSDASSAEQSTGNYHVLAPTMADAIFKAERDDEDNGKAVRVELIATDAIGLIR
jgi:hypothetical protein